MKFADISRSLFQALTPVPSRKPRRRSLAFDSLEGKLLLSTYYVATTGSNSANGSATAPWASIQQAANEVKAGDTVYVAPGTYNVTGAGSYNAGVTTSTSGTSGAPIQFISETSWGAKLTTTGAQCGWWNNGNYVTIQGFEITGDSTQALGIENTGSYVQIIGNHVYGNQTGDDTNGGAGIGSGSYPGFGQDVVTTGNQIIGNVVDNCGQTGIWSSNQGHGIYVADYGSIIANNIIYSNMGIGITSWHYASNVTVSNNLIWNCNDGISLGDPSGTVTLSGCITSNNIAFGNNNYDIEENGTTGSNQYLNNCISTDSTNKSGLQNSNVAENTVNENPDFVNFQSNGSGNYQLAAGSPCINAGTSQGATATDMDGVPRLTGNGYDIGPYEYQTSSDTTPSTVTSENPSTSSIGDPGFEQVVVGAGHFQYDPTGSPWAFSGSSGISGNNSGFTWGNPPAPQGSKVAFLQETGSFTQTVADWAAGSYVLTFDAAQRGNFGVSQQNFNVLIDGNIVGTFTPSGTSYQGYSTAVFTVTTAGPLTITFQGLDSAGGDNTAFIDGVSVS